MRPPIIVMSFNRPQFLGPTLESLKAQTSGALDGRSIHLFQDGAVNRYSGIRYSDDDGIAQSIRLFREAFPHGEVHESLQNIGVCENFHRAEQFAFTELEADCAYFFEDDLVLSRSYVPMLDRLYQWVDAQPNVAYFAAYGDYFARLPPEAEDGLSLANLDHHWAFGLLRRHWRKMQPILKPFYDIVLGQDYSRRDHRGIFRLYEAESASPRASSQDAAKAFACDRLGLWRCNTRRTFARYIGSEGQHMTKELFEKLGFDRASIAGQPMEPRYPTRAEISQKLQEKRQFFENVRQVEFPQLLANLPVRKLNPLRLCSPEEVLFGYRLLLNREPESEGIVNAHAGVHKVFDFVDGLINSKEFAEGPERRGRHLCTRDDIVYAYRLCLHREPDGEGAFDEHVAKTDTLSFTRATLRAEEHVLLRRSMGRG